MKYKALVTAAFMGVLGAATAVHAVPVSYVESGDFGNTNTSGTSVGTFDIGVNTVSGSIFALAGDDRGGSDYGDFWDANLLSGQQITGIDIVITGLIGNMRAFAGDNIVGCCGDDDYTSRSYAEGITSTDGTYELTTTGVYEGYFKTGAYPFDAGHYYFGTLVPGRNASEYSYEWRITVAEVASTVSEPSLLLLLASGLFAMFAGTARGNIRG